MLDKIKEQLIENPDKIVELLSDFGFEHINHRNTEIRFARSDDGGANISIKLKNNPYCCVSDWSRGISTDIISYIIQEKNATFRDVLQTTGITATVSAVCRITTAYESCNHEAGNE